MYLEDSQNNCNNCISPNVGRYFGLVTGPPPAMEAMEAAMEAAAAATERFRRLLDAEIISASLLLGSVKSFSVCYLAKKIFFFDKYVGL